MACYPGQPTNVDSLEDQAYPTDVDVYEGSGNSLKPHSTQSIVTWLEETYHYEDGICLPRSTIYEHYVDFSHREHLQPINAASFGKIIRQQFPQLTTRRLGTRGQSKYHYYGLGIKPTSRYFTEDYLQKQQNQGITRKEPEAKKPHAYYAAKEKPSVVLPKFPDVKNLKQSESVPKEKLQTFMVMYRAHCQRILDSVVRANFDEVEYFLLHFWQGMPPHLLAVLSTDLVVDLVAVCDMTLYNAIISVFITTPLQNIPDNVAQEVKRFTRNLKDWLKAALKDIPLCLTNIKFKAADIFCKSFRRQRSLMHLADAARNAFKGEETLEQLENDWSGLNLQNVFAQTLYTIQPMGVPQHYLDMVPNFLEDFSCMFSYEKCSIEDFALWIDSIMDNCLKDIGKGSKTTAGKVFLLTWKFFTSKVVRDFTLMSAPSFGTFHLLHMLVDDYILHTIENMREKEEKDKHLDRINNLRQGGDDVCESSMEEDSTTTAVACPPQVPSTTSQNFTHFMPESCATYDPAREHSSLDPTPLVSVASQERRQGRHEMPPTANESVNKSKSVVRISSSNEGQKMEFSSSTTTAESISQALHCLQDPDMMMSGGGSGSHGMPMGMDQQQQQSLQAMHVAQQRHTIVPPRTTLKPLPTVTQHQQQHHHHRKQDMFGGQDLLSPQDEVGPGQQQQQQQQQHEQRLSMHLVGSGRNQDTLTSPDVVSGRSLSHPNMPNNMSREEDVSNAMLSQQQQQQPVDLSSSKGPLPHTAQSSILTHSQTGNLPPASIPFQGHLNSFALSSMMGHFAPQLQPQTLSTSALPPNPNPITIDADIRGMGRSQVLPGTTGVSSRSTSGNISQSRIPVTAASNSSSGGSSLLAAGGGLNPASLSIVNPSSFNMGGVNLPGGGLGHGGGGGVINLPHTSNPSMPLAHPIAACNAPSLSLLPGMPAVYSYPYTATIPTQSISSSMVRMNAPGSGAFPPPSQALAPGGGYNQYMPPSLYGNPQQTPPVSTGNYTR